MVLAAVGLMLMYFERLHWLFKPHGDMVVEKKDFRFYFSLTTGIIVSVILSLILSFIFWFLGRK